MNTPGNPQDSTQSQAQPGYIPPTSQPGYSQQDNPQGYGPRGASDDQTWAMLSYILALVASIIAPLVIYLVKMNESRYVRFHAAQALNMGITAFIESIAILIVGIILTALHSTTRPQVACADPAPVRGRAHTQGHTICVTCTRPRCSWQEFLSTSSPRASITLTRP